MRLDRTRIAIIERRQPEILDAALLVFRKFLVPIVALTMLLAVPMAILNHTLIRWMAFDFEDGFTVLRYVWMMCMVVYVEAPLVSVLTTTYIGKVMFYDDPSTLDVLREVGKVFHRLLWVQGIKRGVLPVLCFLYYTEPTEEATTIEIMLPFICVVLFLVRSLRPYVNEILLLERSPLRGKKGEINAGLRSQRLHSPHSGDLFGRGVSMILVTIGLGLAITGVFWFAVSSLTNDWTWQSTMTFIVTPLSLWMLVSYVTVFRFLSYLDLRIRLEGWEVELKIRAEANRLNERIELARRQVG